MTVIARFEVVPIREGSMSTAIARAVSALDRFPVSYETTATSTVIEGDTVDQVFAAVQAAHEAVPDDRVITSVEIDDCRGRHRDMRERVTSVERELGRPARRLREPGSRRARAEAGQRGPPGSAEGRDRTNAAPVTRSSSRGRTPARPRSRSPRPR